MREDTMAQIADVIVAEHKDIEVGALWTQRILDVYPGCMAAISVDVARRWAIVQVRPCEG